MHSIRISGYKLRIKFDKDSLAVEQNCYATKADNGTDHVLSWDSKGLYNSKFKPLFTAFLHSINLSGYNVRIKFDGDSLVVEQNNYPTMTLNASTFFD